MNIDRHVIMFARNEAAVEIVYDINIIPKSKKDLCYFTAPPFIGVTVKKWVVASKVNSFIQITQQSKFFVRSALQSNCFLAPPV